MDVRKSFFVRPAFKYFFLRPETKLYVQLLSIISFPYVQLLSILERCSSKNVFVRPARTKIVESFEWLKARMIKSSPLYIDITNFIKHFSLHQNIFHCTSNQNFFSWLKNFPSHPNFFYVATNDFVTSKFFSLHQKIFHCASNQNFFSWHCRGHPGDPPDPYRPRSYLAIWPKQLVTDGRFG